MLFEKFKIKKERKEIEKLTKEIDRLRYEFDNITQLTINNHNNIQKINQILHINNERFDINHQRLLQLERALEKIVIKLEKSSIFITKI